MRSILLVLLTLLLTGCYTSFHVVEDRPHRTVITSPTHIDYYMYSHRYNQFWYGDRYSYIPRYYIVSNTTIVNKPNVERRKTRVIQPRSNGLTQRQVRQRTTRSSSVEMRQVQQRNRGEVRSRSNTRNDRSSNSRKRNRNQN